MKWVAALCLFGATALSLLAVPPAKSKSRPKAAVTGVHSKSTSSKTAGSTASTRNLSARTRSRRRRVAPAPSYQLHPDAERYKQIQQALADKGYFKGEVNGQWNDDSIGALKRFQGDQKIDDDGKINARTLIGLGLGPKHDGSSVAAVNSPGVPEPPPPPVNLESPSEDQK